MDKNFWQNLPKPFFCLAPMADVTDMVFRELIAKYSKKNKDVVFWTEFVSADGLMSAGREILQKDLGYSGIERPIVAQLFSSNVEKMREASNFVALLGFDGIDINMGCPDRSIEKQGCGAGMIKNPENAKDIIQAVKDGIADAGCIIPVSVKTRIGYNKIEIDTWVPFLLRQDIQALTVHMRTRKEMSKVSAHWDLMKDILKYRDEISPNTKIIGNGDAIDVPNARVLAEEFGCDGIMLGRAIFGNPWLFAEKTPTIEEKLRVMIEHTKNFEEKLGSRLIRIIDSDGRTTEKVVLGKNFAIMKKHYKAYVNGFPGSKELRVKLMETTNSQEVENIVNEFLKYLEVRLPDILI